jgi:hypothetical protein
LAGSEKQSRFYRALEQAYLRPAHSHQEAARVLDVPYGTFRRWLKEGSRLLCDYLWEREINS